MKSANMFAENSVIQHLIGVAAFIVWNILPVESPAADSLRKIDYARDVRPVCRSDQQERGDRPRLVAVRRRTYQ